MKTDTYRLAVPADWLGEVRQTSQDLGLSMTNIMRQSMKLGSPKLREQLSPGPLRNLKPLSKAESRRCYQKPNPEFDALEHDRASLHCGVVTRPGRQLAMRVEIIDCLGGMAYTLRHDSRKHRSQSRSSD